MISTELSKDRDLAVLQSVQADTELVTHITH